MTQHDGNHDYFGANPTTNKYAEGVPSISPGLVAPGLTAVELAESALVDVPQDCTALEQ